MSSLRPSPDALRHRTNGESRHGCAAEPAVGGMYGREHPGMSASRACTLGLGRSRGVCVVSRGRRGADRRPYLAPTSTRAWANINESSGPSDFVTHKESLIFRIDITRSSAAATIARVRRCPDPKQSGSERKCGGSSVPMLRGSPDHSTETAGSGRPSARWRWRHLPPKCPRSWCPP